MEHNEKAKRICGSLLNTVHCSVKQELLQMLRWSWMLFTDTRFIKAIQHHEQHPSTLIYKNIITLANNNNTDANVMIALWINP